MPERTREVLTAPARTSRALLRLLAATLVVAVAIATIGGLFGWSSYQRVLHRLDRSETGRREDRATLRDQAATIRELLERRQSDSAILDQLRTIAVLFAQVSSSDRATRDEAIRRLGEIAAQQASAGPSTAGGGQNGPSTTRPSATPTGPTTTTTRPRTTTTRCVLVSVIGVCIPETRVP